MLEKRLLLPRFQNTVLVTYTLVAGDGPVRLGLRPLLNARPHEAPVDHPLPEAPTLSRATDQLEVQLRAEHPAAAAAARRHAAARSPSTR